MADDSERANLALAELIAALRGGRFPTAAAENPATAEPAPARREV